MALHRLHGHRVDIETTQVQHLLSHFYLQSYPRVALRAIFEPLSYILETAENETLLPKQHYVTRIAYNVNVGAALHHESKSSVSNDWNFLSNRILILISRHIFRKKKYEQQQKCIIPVYFWQQLLLFLLFFLFFTQSVRSRWAKIVLQCAFWIIPKCPFSQLKSPFLLVNVFIFFLSFLENSVILPAAINLYSRDCSCHFLD